MRRVPYFLLLTPFSLGLSACSSWECPLGTHNEDGLCVADEESDTDTDTDALSDLEDAISGCQDDVDELLETTLRWESFSHTCSGELPYEQVAEGVNTEIWGIEPIENLDGTWGPTNDVALHDTGVLEVYCGHSDYSFRIRLGYQR